MTREKIIAEIKESESGRIKIKYGTKKHEFCQDMVFDGILKAWKTNPLSDISYFSNLIKDENKMRNAKVTLIGHGWIIIEYETGLVLNGHAFNSIELVEFCNINKICIINKQTLSIDITQNLQY